MTKDELFKLLKEGLPFNIGIADKDHGWAEQTIRVRLPKADLLVSAIPEGIAVTCMCFVSAPTKAYDRVVKSNEIVDEIKKLINHACVPWPG